MDKKAIREAARMILESKHVVVLTGAGISTPSGIPDFRSPSYGLWARYDPFEVASLWGFREHPERFYDWARSLMDTVQKAKPNPAHEALARLEEAGYLRTIITQNIDSLHQKAGSSHVIPIHGHVESATCLDCGAKFPIEEEFWDEVRRGEIPRCPKCGGLLKPDVVLFGEPLPYGELREAQQEALLCDLMIVAGSSLMVMPAADLPLLAKRRGSKLILINLQWTTVDSKADLLIREDVAKALPAIADLVLREGGRR